MEKFFRLSTAVSGVAHREEMLEGKLHHVFPVVMLVEGVHNGLLYTAEELSKFVMAWNGIPVPISHPSNPDGSPLTANCPLVQEARNVGRIYSTYFDSVAKALKAEVWISEDKIKEVSPETLTAMLNGEKMEVSTGLYSEVSYINGLWKNEAYHGVASNIRPDHLALLPEQIGACSWKDGCGIRNCAIRNQEQGGKMDAEKSMLRNFVRRLFGRDPNPSEEAVINESLSFKDIRESLYKALSEKGIGSNSYIMDVYPDEKYFVYEVEPSMGPDGKYPPSKLWQRGYSMTDAGVCTLDDDAAEVTIKTVYKKVTNEANPSEKTGLLGAMQIQIETVGLEQARETMKEMVALAAVLNEKTNTIGKELRTMSDCKDGKICPNRVNALINSGMFTEEKREYLSTLKVEQVELLEQAAGITHTHDDPPKTNKEEPAKEEPKKEESTTNAEAPKTLDDLLGLAPADVQEQIKESMKLRDEHRQGMIKTITANSANTFTADELAAKTTTELEKIATLSSAHGNFALRGGAGVPPYTSKKEDDGTVKTNRQENGMGVPPAPTLNIAKRTREDKKNG